MPQKAPETVSCSCLQLSTLVCTPLQGAAAPHSDPPNKRLLARTRGLFGGFGGVGGSLLGEERGQLSDGAE
eukprot:3767444-Alexandrium_andersonii.AAC.1